MSAISPVSLPATTSMPNTAIMAMASNVRTQPLTQSTTPSPQTEGVLVVEETLSQCKETGTGTPKAPKAPKKPKTPVTTKPPARVKGGTGTTPKQKTSTKKSTVSTIPPNDNNVAVSVVQSPTEPALIPVPILINGEPPSKSTKTLSMLEKLPILNTVTVRAGKAFRKDAKRMSREEAWVGTERGERAEKPCDRCSRGNNPFTDCCTAEGVFKGACANCHYGGNASRCSFYQAQQNAEAHLIAAHIEAPAISGMAPANYTGGSLKNGGFTIVGTSCGPLLECVPRPEEATPGVARGGGEGGKRRIAPTPAPLVGFGSTEISRKAHAKSLTSGERRRVAMQCMELVRTLKEAADEEGDECWGKHVLDITAQSRKRKRDGDE